MVACASDHILCMVRFRGVCIGMVVCDRRRLENDRDAFWRQQMLPVPEADVHRADRRRFDRGIDGDCRRRHLLCRDRRTAEIVLRPARLKLSG